MFFFFFAHRYWKSEWAILFCSLKKSNEQKISAPTFRWVNLLIGKTGENMAAIAWRARGPVPRAEKGRLGFQVCRAKVVAQRGYHKSQWCWHPWQRTLRVWKSNSVPLWWIANPLRWALASHFPRVRVMGNLLDRTAASSFEKSTGRDTFWDITARNGFCTRFTLVKSHQIDSKMHTNCALSTSSTPYSSQELGRRSQNVRHFRPMQTPIQRDPARDSSPDIDRTRVCHDTVKFWARSCVPTRR